MKPRAVLALTALAIGSAIGVSVIVPRLPVWNSARSSTVVRPAVPSSSTKTAASAPIDVDPARQREHAVAIESDVSGYRITVLDEAGRPIFGARAWSDDSEAVLASDAAGVLRFGRAGVEGLLVADGFLPRTFEVPVEPLELRLEPDPGLGLRLLWMNGEPVVGARVHVAFDDAETNPARFTGDPIPATDAQGRTSVRPYRIGSETAHLWVEPPGVARTLVRLPGGLDLAGPASYEARLARGGAGHRVRFVDAEGRPLADREVTYHLAVDETVRTDAVGWSAFGVQALELPEGSPPGTRYLTNYSVELEPERSWWYEHGHPAPGAGDELTLRVAPVRVFGRVETPAPDSYVVATAATVHLKSVRDARFHPEELEQLAWRPLAADGSFEIREGWQGRESLVLLRHRDRPPALWIEPVPAAGGPVLLSAPDVCRVSIVSDTVLKAPLRLGLYTEDLLQPTGEQEEAAYRISFFPDGYVLWIDVHTLPSSIEVPRARYSTAGRLHGNEWEGGGLDATGPSVTLELELPEVVSVRGRISGSLRGPLAGVSVALRSADMEDSQKVDTGSDGWFEARVLSNGAIRVVPSFEGASRLLGPRDRSGLEPALDAERPVAEYVLPEAVLNVVERPPSPQLRSKTLWLDALSEDGAKPLRSERIELGPDGRARLYVSPGTYRIRRRLAAGTVQSATVTLDADGEREAVLDSSQIAAIALSVSVADPGQRSLYLRAWDADGALVALDHARRLKGETHEFLDIVERGTYSVEVESRPRNAPTTEPPLDVWRGQYEAVPGAQVPLRIHLR
jgi:hypothetical protein